jgi:surface antigen
VIAHLRRPKLPRKAAVALSAALLTFGGLAVVAPPAEATVSTLCVGYTGCARLGMSDAGYSKVGKTMYWRMYGGHNCTNYAAYRMIKAGMPNTRPWSGGGNATYWGTSMKSITNSTPRVGAVAWWKARVYPAGSAGHVAYVEKVVSSTEIIVSMDSWNGDFSWARVTKATKGWPSGFVHFKDVLLKNTAAPKISGTPKVGSRLTASAGSWSVSGSSYTYQWLANGAAVSGATASTLTVTDALRSKAISVRVTASHLGYANAAATSATTSTVQAGVISNKAAPTISGDPRVDSTLTANPGSWDPAGAALAYSWQADGQPIDGQTARTLTLDPSMVGQAIRVQVTASKTGYAAVSALSAATDPVGPGVMRPTTSPTLTGAAVPGSTLRVGPFAADPRATQQIRWERARTYVAGARSSTYRLTAADLGRRLRAVIVLKRPGYERQVLTTPITRVIRSRAVLRVAATPGHRRLALRATARALGVPDFNGVLQVRSHGKLLRSVPVRHGVAAATVTRLPVGKRTYRFRLMTTTKSLHADVVRRIVVRR